jgi:receptor protein-tyrosine kinase
MNSGAQESLTTVDSEDIHKAIVLLYRLSNDAIEHINELMQTLRIRFEDAALQTGAIDQAQLDRAIAWVRERAMLQGRSIVEEAMRRSIKQRVSVTWEGEQLLPDPCLVLARAPDHPRSEQLRRLRTELLLRIRNRRSGGSLALVSPSTGEGRSQLAADLAISFAQLGRRTLLVDADLRRPRQHLLFGASNDYGLTAALTDPTPVRLYGVKGLADMALLTSGALPSNPVELLSGRRFELLVTEWRRNFEFIVFDTPPTSEFSDASAIATVVGNVVVAGRKSQTSFTSLKELSRALEPTQASVLGAVLSEF